MVTAVINHTLPNVISIFAFIAGLVLTFLPHLLQTQSLLAANELSTFATRELGIMLIGFGLLTYFVCMSNDSVTKRGYFLSIAVMSFLLSTLHLLDITRVETDQVFSLQYNLSEALLLISLSVSCLYARKTLSMNS